MKMDTNRLVLTVMRHDGVWAIEEGGRFFGHAPEKDIVRATANKHARQMQDEGRPCQVRISGEHGFFAG